MLGGLVGGGGVHLHIEVIYPLLFCIQNVWSGVHYTLLNIQEIIYIECVVSISHVARQNEQ